jgi:MoaA/NifB/PqqE/SkfB family radical SAM enzyme
MTSEGLVLYDPIEACTIRYNKEETDEIFSCKKPNFTKYDLHCEVAHCEISNKCNMSCPECYTGKKEGKELSTIKWKSIIQNLAEYGVFQCSFGGGEPTLRNDLFELAEFTREQGLNLAMTTNGSILPDLNPQKIKKYFNQINVSWHGNYEVINEALSFLFCNKIKSGINFYYSKTTEKDNKNIKKLARKWNSNLLYLLYKPVIGDWENQISGEDIYKIAKESYREGLSVSVDGPCAGKCMMKKRFVDIDSLGEVFPCSFMRNSIGNILKTSFKDIWSKRGGQDKCRFQREE